ncbi:MAG TPA: HNH endonuclease signature motif containing protein [Anaeromyxobacteraceae bacterium]|nr:HNH endonuclease signature motif containing protein [Anaeromyxobacteraceae bacterium]
MGEPLDTGDAALAARFEAVVEEIRTFRPREPHHHPNLLGGEASIPFERILAGLVRGREAIDLAIGEGLCLLEDRDQLMHLGYSKMTDYAREELGLPEGTARDKARLARELGIRPLLREAVWSGRVAPRRAREIFPVARGDAEQAWLSLARTLTVRELNAAVKRVRAGSSGEAPACAGAPAPPEGAPAADEERWTLVSLEVPPEYRVVLEEAMRLAEKALWPGAPRWRQLEAIAEEFLGGYPAEPEQDELRELEPAPGRIPPGELEKALEIESEGWSWLEAVEPLTAPEVLEAGPEALDAGLKDLVARRQRWDVVFGRMARLFARKGMARELGFASLGHYLRERLGMSRRAFEQRVWLERRMEALPQLRHALEKGELSYEQARLVAGVADFDSVNGWIRRAAGMTCVELARAIAGTEDAQACARGKVEVRMPEEVSRLLGAALGRAAQVFGRELFPGESLLLVAWHFVPIWGPSFWGRSRPSRVRRRDGPWCTVPGCSRPSAQDHHLVFQSHGGGNDLGNMTALCAPHHLRGIHGGRLRVSGTAPDRLVWHLANGRPFRPGVGPGC